MTDENKDGFNVNINESEKEYVEDSFAALVDFSVTVTRKYTKDGKVGFDVVGTEVDSYVSHLQSNDDGDAVKETLSKLEQCRGNWSIMGVVLDDEESKQEFINSIQNSPPFSDAPDPTTPQKIEIKKDG